MDVRIIDLVRRFDAGEIRLPLMQRDYVWRPPKVVKLLDSLYKRWPIGCFYVWNTRHDQPTKGRVGGRSVGTRSLDSFYGFLLDGQQRLTSLSLATAAPAPENLATCAFFDLERGVFVLGRMKRTVEKRIANGDPTLVPLSDLIPATDAAAARLHESIDGIMVRLEEAHRLQPRDPRATEYRQRLHAVAGMLDVKAMCEEFKDDHVENAIELFARLNKGGTSLSAGDVEAARLSQEATSGIVGPMRDFVQDPDLQRLGFNFVFVTRALVTVHRGNSTFSNLPQNWATGGGEDIRRSWKLTETALAGAADLVKDHLGWTTRRWLPSVNALIAVAYLSTANGGKLPKSEFPLAARFLLLTGLRSLFRGSVETAINTYVNAARNAKGRGRGTAKLLLGRIPRNQLYPIRRDDIRNASGMYSPLMQVYLAYLVSRGARSWPSGRPLKDVVHERALADPLAVHHIFPKKFMQQLDIPPERLNTMANYAILAQSDNAHLADRDPMAAYQDLSPKEREYAQDQLFLLASPERLDPKAYDEFLDYRTEKLAAALNEFLGLTKRSV